MAAIADVLNARPDKPFPVVRQRPRPLAVENPDETSGLDAIVLYAVREESTRPGDAPSFVQHTRNIRFEITVAGEPPLDEKADPIYLWIVETLMSDEGSTALAVEDGEQKKFWMEEVGMLWETVSTYEDASVCALEMRFSFVTTLDPSVRV